MATILTHPAVPILLRLAGGPRAVPGRLLAAGAIASVLPDVDAIGFWVGVPYEHLCGHRGITHSLAFACALGAVAAARAAWFGASRRSVFLVIALSAASHGVLDALTDGGLGVAFLSPFSNERWFFPWRPLVVAPIGLDGFFTRWGAEILLAEAICVWGPALLIGYAFAAFRPKEGDAHA